MGPGPIPNEVRKTTVFNLLFVETLPRCYTPPWPRSSSRSAPRSDPSSSTTETFQHHCKRDYSWGGASISILIYIHINLGILPLCTEP